jgi:SAM-dependent methyltransferase
MAEIIYYSEGKKVSMADSWFEVATLQHFWVKRRFEVLRRLLGYGFKPTGPVAEVGCGHGLVQAQFHEFYGVPVDGYELNEFALSQSVAKDQPRYIYDIYERREELKGKYSVIIMFDVIEHIEDEKGFLEAVLFHLAPGGLLVVNVPALQFLFSNYDRAAGHVRRYSLPQLTSLGKTMALEVVAGSYWGLPLLPLLALRKLLLSFQSGEKEVINQGFKPPSLVANKLLLFLCAFEPIPQKLLGTSAMSIFKKP